LFVEISRSADARTSRVFSVQALGRVRERHFGAMPDVDVSAFSLGSP